MTAEFLHCSGGKTQLTPHSKLPIQAVLLQNQVPLAVPTIALNQGHPTPGLGHQGKLLCSNVFSCTQGIFLAENQEMLPLRRPGSFDRH